MTQKFILHIGPPKTGTSSLQEVLFRHQDQLSAQGYEYPAFGRHADMSKLPGHHGIPDGIRKHGAVPPEVLEQLALLPEGHRVILSSENFAHLDDEGVRVLLRTLGPENVEIIYYARRWDQLLPSVWQELVKHGHSQPYLEFLNRQISAPMASIYLNYMQVLDRWARVTGRSRLRIFSYDNMRATGQDIVQHFCRDVLGITLDTSGESQVNRRQSVADTETLRVLNFLVFAGKAGTPKVRFALESKRKNVQAHLSALEDLYKSYQTVAPTYPPFVFAHIEHQFIKAYGPRIENLAPDGRLLEDRGVRAAPYIRQDYLLQEGVTARFQDLLREIGPF